MYMYIYICTSIYTDVLALCYRRNNNPNIMCLMFCGQP